MNKSYIPPIIHYCWFGKKEKPDDVKEYIQGWKDILQDFDFIEWNEDNFPIDYNRYTLQAYKSKKYAFVSDVARLYALNKYGGFYLDTDVELRKTLTNFCDNSSAIFAFESETQVMTGFLAAPPNHMLIKQFLDMYRSASFINEDGTLDVTPNTDRLTKLLVEKGLKFGCGYQKINDDIEVYPMEIFGAYDVDNSCFVINDETVLVHHCVSSWMPVSYRFKDHLKRFVAKIIGRDRVKKIRDFLRNR